MKLICAPNGLVDIRYPRQGMLDITGAGFTESVLDFSMCVPPNVLEKSNGQAAAETFEKSAERLIQAFKEHNLNVSVALAPFLLPETKRQDLNALIEQLAVCCIKLCGKYSCGKLIVRPLFAGIAKEEWWQVNRAYYMRLAQTAAEQEVEILLENQTRAVNGHCVRGICSDEVIAAQWIDTLNEETNSKCFGFCMNVSSYNLCGQNMQEAARILGDRIHAVIISEGNGNLASSMLPFTSVYGRSAQTDWRLLIRGLREIAYDGFMIFQFEDTAAAFPPVLRPHLVKLVKPVADFFQMELEVESLLKKYPTRVLFGAGDLFRFYMSSYGKKYPPLYTCDNNLALWGKEVCGISVKSPEELRKLPKDCPVFICNLYYRDIRCQLEKMNIENPIEFIDGDYLPTFYCENLMDKEK